MTDRTNGVAWGQRQDASMLDCYYYYDSNTAQYPDPRGLMIYRPSTTYFDWQNQFMPYVTVAHSGTPCLLMNEPDNGKVKPGGEPEGDNLTPKQAVLFVAEAIRRWPKIQWVGPNTVRQADWLNEFLKQWRRHGLPLTGKEQPFDIWGVHVYGSGAGHAMAVLDWFAGTVTGYGHQFNRVWVTEYCSKNEVLLERWTRDIRNHPAVRWFGVFAPWLRTDRELREAYQRGLT